MTSIIRMCPLSGGVAPSRDEVTPHCYLLEVDQFTFLLDCGWDSTSTSKGGGNEGFLRELKRNAPRVDAVLLSHPDPLYLGSLPHAVGHLGLSCPIYATVPVYKMGQMFLYDIFQARHSTEEFDHFTLDEVDRTFEMMTQLKYNQTVSLKGKGEGLTITPLPAGHSIGGAMWKIVKDGEEDIVYAVDFNHKRERHLNGFEVEKIARPSLLITDSFNASLKQLRRGTRDEKLMTNILQTLRGGGNVLVAVDTAGRVLELSHMLDHLWQNKDSGLLAYSLAMVNNVSYNVVEFAKSQIEWMSDKLMRAFEGQRSNPFQFRHLKLCHSMAEVNKVPSPKVVLASTPDMECGFSRELFALWAGHPKNSIVVTSRSPRGTLAHDLVEKGGNDRLVGLEMRKRVRLTGAELEEHRRRQKQEAAAAAAAAAANGEKMDQNDESSSDDEDEPGKHDIITTTTSSETPKQTFFKSTKSKYLMFPFHEEKIRWDDYGELIRLEDWIDVDAAAAAAVKEEKRVERIDSDSQNVAPAAEVPTKCLTTVVKVQVKAQVQYIDFEGRSDGESIYKCIAKIKPRRVVIVRGSEEDSRALADFCSPIATKVAMDSQAGAGGDEANKVRRVFCPRNGELVDATTESHIYQARLPDSLVSKLIFKQGKDDVLLAWVDGRIAERPQEANPELKCGDEPMDDQQEDKKPSIPTLEPIPDEEVRPHQANFINELKLSDFKMILSKNGVSSEFQGGVLFCGANGSVALRRHDSGRVTIEGCVCEDYYTVRNLLYQQYAIV